MWHILLGMKRRDGLQGMENQIHQVEGRKTMLLCIGRGLGKEMGMAIFLVPKIRMRKGRSLDHVRRHLGRTNMALKSLVCRACVSACRGLS